MTVKGFYIPNVVREFSGHLELVLQNRYGAEVATTKIDKADYDIVRGFRWSMESARYAMNRRAGKLHRLILSAPADKFVDHISFDRLDNRRENIRLVTITQNIIHRKHQKNNKSGFIGVSWDESKRKWRAACGRKILGCFDSIDEAVVVRDAAAKAIYGEYAILNFPTA